MSHVACPVTITSPGHVYGDRGINLPPNQPCGEHCEVHKPAPTMLFKCPKGHTFTAGTKDIHEQ